MSNVIDDNDPKRKRYDIPEITYLPGMNNVLIFRLEGEQKTAGGIVIPDEHKEVKSRGILLAAGLEAYDKLTDALIEVGDEVCFGHWAGRDRETGQRTAGAVSKKVLECKAEDVLGSVEAVKRVKNYTIGLDDDGNSMYQRKEA